MSATDTHSSSTKIFPLPPLEDEMRSQEVVLGYLIDDKFVHKFFLNRACSKGLYDVTTSEGPFRRHVKASIARRAAQQAGCSIAVLDVNLPRDSGEKEEAIIVAFYRRGPRYTDTYPPTARRMAKFKAQLFLSTDDDPQWHILK
ncbi:hypothetical protein APHAL10511_006972 [Amanita phalloides]|nr:hypothetical protein APHAL10511_006972 [Amanita phalloides]